MPPRGETGAPAITSGEAVGRPALFAAMRSSRSEASGLGVCLTSSGPIATGPAVNTSRLPELALSLL